MSFTKTAQDFIQSSFSPNIAILCSSKIDNVMIKNNLSFTELLQPFTNLEWQGQFRDPGGSVCTIKNWRLVIKDVNWKPLPPTEARKQLNNAVLNNYNDHTVSIELAGRTCIIPQGTKWFDAWRETYLEVQFPSDHEYTKHFLSCILVASASEDNIVDTFTSLNQQYAQLQNIPPPKLPKWFQVGVLKSYLILHDVSVVPKEKAEATFAQLKQHFGTAGCFMLPINSKSTSDPVIPIDYWTPYIKRSSEINNDISSSLATSPMEPHPSVVNIAVDDVISNSSSAPSEGEHPLTSTEVDIFDNANSLQTHSFSGSSESVSVANRNFDVLTEVHGAALNANDIDGIKKFLLEYASSCLLPYLEKQIAQLSEVVSNKKGVSRSLISVTKRWFGTGKGGNTAANNTVIYSSDCPELQLRRLGDLWFLCGQWQRAYDIYHTAKREFYGDSAWLCYAGALEMAALSAFMAGEANRKTYGYMEESIVTYLNVCRMVQYAVRATLLSVLCLQSAGLHGEAAKQLIRMTSEDSDLRSAMLLEQAALCFLSGPGTKPMYRKYAFHMVLAGHRFSKAGQKKHAHRCYSQAYQIYMGSGWRLSTDHVQFTLGRLASALRLTQEAVRWLSEPLAPAAEHQTINQQESFLREYMLAHQQWVGSTEKFKDNLPILPLPLLERDETAVLCVGPAPLSSPGRQGATSINFNDTPSVSPNEIQHWHKMEEMLLQVAYGSVPMIFKPTVDLYTKYTDCNPSVPYGEPIQISITLRNPLKIWLLLKNVELLWDFVASSDNATEMPQVQNNEPSVACGVRGESSVIRGEKLESVVLEGESKKVLIFHLTPAAVGQLSLKGLAYRLINGGEGGKSVNGVSISGKVNLSDVSGEQRRLQITIIPPAPCLQMTFGETSADAMSGEMRQLEMELSNAGPVDMSDVYIAVSHPECITLVTGPAQSETPENFQYLFNEKYRVLPSDMDERAIRAMCWREIAARHVTLAAVAVPRGGMVRAVLLLRVHSSTPDLRLLAFYRCPRHPRGYRLLRHTFHFRVTEVVEMNVVPRRSLKKVRNVNVECLNLSLEMKNTSSEKQNLKINILEVSLLGMQWALIDYESGDAGKRALSSRERVHLILRAVRRKNISQPNKVEWTCFRMSDHPSSQRVICELPYCKFITENKSSYIDDGLMNIAQERKRGMIQSMLVVRWKAEHSESGRTVIGQHSLWIECFSNQLDPIAPNINLIKIDETSSDSAKSKNITDNMFSLKMEHTDLVDHDFKKKKMCLIPVTLNIVNCHEVPIKIFIDMSSRQESQSGGEMRRSNELGWTGALSYGAGGEEKRRLGVKATLERYETRCIPLHAVCASPGTYTLGPACASAATLHDDNMYRQHFTDTTLLVVRQISSK